MYSRGAWLFVGATLCVSGVAQATALYDNTVNPTGYNATLSGNTWADDLHLTSSGLARSLEFGYIANGSFSATVSLYGNDATNSIWPGNGAPLLYTTIVFIDPNSSGIAVHVIDPPLPVGEDVWFSIKFSGFSAAVPLYNPPFDGTSDDVLVRGSGSLWDGSAPANYFGVGRNNFQVRIGTEIPTPGSACLFGCSIAMVLSHRKRR